MIAPTFDGSFPHSWTAEVLPNRPMILPSRQFVYPGQAEEVEKGAMEVLIQPNGNLKEFPPDQVERRPQPFLATCALGFRDPSAPSGIWSMPHPDWLCAVSGGYAYLINVTDPSKFKMLHYRPVLGVLPLVEHGLLLFIGHHAILAWGKDGEAWQSDRLSWEGITVTQISNERLDGTGWDMQTDKDVPFTIDLKTGQRL